MSNAWIKAALDNGTAKNGARLMLFVLADRADEAGVSYYGMETLIKCTALSHGSAHAAINQLEKLGLLKVQYKAGRNGCNIYTLQNLDCPDIGPSRICTVQNLEPTLQNLDSHPPESGPNPLVIPHKTTITKARATLEECRAFAHELGLPESDGDSFFAVKEENGWKNGPNKIRDAKATFSNWHRRGFHPSQKASGTNDHTVTKPKRLPSSRDLYPQPA